MRSSDRAPHRFRRWIIPLAGIVSVGILVGFGNVQSLRSGADSPKNEWWFSPDSVWSAPDITLVDSLGLGAEILYGRELIAHTAEYFGPMGILGHTSNGMNCQNCHLDAGTRPWGNNYSAVFSMYPKFRERSGTVESIAKRVNDCFVRSLNGLLLDTNSREMRAILAYIQWLGQGVPKGVKPVGAGIEDIPYLSRAANPLTGKKIFNSKCAVCHQNNGEGLKMPGNPASYLYPPLWGKSSYSVGAGLYRLSRFAGYVKNNMPLGATKELPQLTNEESWDVAAFVNSNPRPTMDTRPDFRDSTRKPVDYPFGPYADGFSERQHKFGPFAPIVAKRQEQQTRPPNK